MSLFLNQITDLERPAGTTQAQIESYRLPSIREFARVCLHTGYAAPNTCYVGRPLSDSGDFKYDFIKVAVQFQCNQHSFIWSSLLGR